MRLMSTEVGSLRSRAHSLDSHLNGKIDLVLSLTGSGEPYFFSLPFAVSLSCRAFVAVTIIAVCSTCNHRIFQPKNPKRKFFRSAPDSRNSQCSHLQHAHTDTPSIHAIALQAWWQRPRITRCSHTHTHILVHIGHGKWNERKSKKIEANVNGKWFFRTKISFVPCSG